MHTHCVKKGYFDRDELAEDVTYASPLKQKHITHEEIKGLHRTFPFYIKFPKEDWPEIERAEKFTSEGELVFRELSKRYKDEYFDPKKIEPRFQQIGQI